MTCPDIVLLKEAAITNIRKTGIEQFSLSGITKNHFDFELYSC